MPLIQKHERHKFVGGNIQLAVVHKKRDSDLTSGGNIISTVSNLISNNSDLISNVGKVAGTVGSIASASNSITNAVKSAIKLSSGMLRPSCLPCRTAEVNSAENPWLSSGLPGVYWIAKIISSFNSE